MANPSGFCDVEVLVRCCPDDCIIGDGGCGQCPCMNVSITATNGSGISYTLIDPITAAVYAGGLADGESVSLFICGSLPEGELLLDIDCSPNT